MKNKLTKLTSKLLTIFLTNILLFSCGRYYPPMKEGDVFRAKMNKSTYIDFTFIKSQDSTYYFHSKSSRKLQLAFKLLRVYDIIVNEQKIKDVCEDFIIFQTCVYPVDIPRLEYDITFNISNEKITTFTFSMSDDLKNINDINHYLVYVNTV